MILKRFESLRNFLTTLWHCAINKNKTVESTKLFRTWPCSQRLVSDVCREFLGKSVSYKCSPLRPCLGFMDSKSLRNVLTEMFQALQNCVFRLFIFLEFFNQMKTFFFEKFYLPILQLKYADPIFSTFLILDCNLPSLSPHKMPLIRY